MAKNTLLFFFLSLSMIMAGCSKSDSLSDDEDDAEGGGSSMQTSYAPKDVKNKVFKVSGHSFVVTFKSNESCTVSESSSVVNSTIIGIPTCSYKRLSDNRSSLQLTYQSKLTISSSAYSTIVCSYDFTLDFTQDGGGNAKGPYHYSIKTYTMGKLSTSEKNGNINKSFTLN